MSNKSQFIKNLIVSMTLKEKIGQMSQFGSYKEKQQMYLKEGRIGSFLNSLGSKRNNELQKQALNTRLGIPLLFGCDVIHGFETIFPIPLAEAASFDLKLIKKSAQLAAKEAYANGINWIFAPMIDLSVDARFGRVAEGAGEDPYYNSAVAKARVTGFQQNHKVAACAKHFGAYGALRGGRDYQSSTISESTFLNEHLPSFEAAIKAGVKTIMTSFVDLENVPFTMNKKMVNTLLRKKLRFKGLTVSDWSAIEQLIPYGVAKDRKEAAKKALLASLDMDMHSACYIENLEELVAEDPSLLSYIDESVERILGVKYDLGLFDQPYFEEYDGNPLEHSLELRKHALKMAQESIVLLKNDHEILPLQKKIDVAWIGPFVEDQEAHLGCWSYLGKIDSVTSIAQALQDRNMNPIHYARGCKVQEEDDSFHQAIEIASKAEAIVVTLGESRDMSGENNSRVYPTIPFVQKKLFQELKKLKKPIISVILAGRPLVLEEIVEQSDAILYAWHLGVEAGNAIVNVLYGKVNPSAKLPMSIPYAIGQIPITYYPNKSGRPELTHYLDAPNTPLYPFGYGLSYTTFALSDLRVLTPSINKKEKLEVEVTVENTGDIDGKEVVQVYFDDLVASVVTPIRKLCAFHKVTLKAKRKQIIHFTIAPQCFSFIDEKKKRVIEEGMFRLMVSQDNINFLEATFEIR